MAQELQKYRQNFGLIFDFLCLNEHLYFMVLEGTLTSSGSITSLLSIVRTMNTNDMMVFIEECLQFFSDPTRCAPKKSGQQENAMDKELVILQSIRDRLVALLDIVSEDSVT
ncbi:hypothetical protein BGZ65_004831, partial [Modicella reniformis]